MKNLFTLGLVVCLAAPIGCAVKKPAELRAAFPQYWYGNTVDTTFNRMHPAFGKALMSAYDGSGFMVTPLDHLKYESIDILSFKEAFETITHHDKKMISEHSFDVRQVIQYLYDAAPLDLDFRSKFFLVRIKERYGIIYAWRERNQWHPCGWLLNDAMHIQDTEDFRIPHDTQFISLR